MDETIYVIFKVQFDFAVEVWFTLVFYRKFEPRHEISNNVVCATSKGSDQPAHTLRLIRAFVSRLHILLILSY